MTAHTVIICCLIGSVFMQSLDVEILSEDYLEIPELHSVNISCVVNNAGDYPDAVIAYRWTRIGDDTWVLLGQYLEYTFSSSDAGEYQCEAAANDPPLNGVDSIYIEVLYFPRWVDGEFTKFAGRIGDTVTLECHVRAVPEPQFYWSFSGVNVTRNVVSDVSVSTLDVTINSDSDYGDYTCHALNSQGHGEFTIELKEPGIPDAPQSCEAINVTDHEALLKCVPGYDGGEPLDFAVDKQSPHDKRERADSNHQMESGGNVTITVEGLKPNTNWTLSVYQVNVHGQSDSSIGVLIRTKDGPPLKEDKPMDLIAIICGAVAGVVFIVVVIIVITCCILRREPKEESDTRFAASEKKDTGSYVMDDEEGRGKLSRQDSNRKSWNSFRRKRPVRNLSGVQNPNYTGSSEHVNNARPANYDGPSSPVVGSDKSQFSISLGPVPGESSDTLDGHDNRAYVNHSEIQQRETSFGYEQGSRSSWQAMGYSSPNRSRSGSQDPQVELRRQLADPAERANRLSQGQPSLAGAGALSYLPDPTKVNNRTPLAPSVSRGHAPASRKSSSGAEDRVSLSGVNVPSFQPEVPWEFPRNKLYIRRKLGEGSFGEVWRAQAEGILRVAGKKLVAVKMLKEHHTPEEKRALLKELEVMKLLQPHPNIISLMGCCTVTEPLCLIMEYAANGNLQDLLRRQRSAFDVNDLNNSDLQQRHDLKIRDLTIFGLHIASGMEYIASQKLLHRDLAARNVLVNEQMICKVCDFGSARDIAEMRQYESKTQRRLPIRWMAPESLYQCIYSTASDVWSFGILLWEIITLGSSPYPGMSGPEVMKFIQKGCRMEKPKHCSNAMHAVMKDCTSQYPQKRPSFTMLCHRLAAILDEPNCNMYIDELEDNVYDILPQQPGEKC